MIIIFTVKEHAQTETIEKKSKFISNIYPITSKKEADELISKTRKEYWDARHNVYAYMLINNISKYSDDGEPQGTSGLSVFNVIVGNNLENVLIIVTRYFGGILLGKGGLMRAYSSAAKTAIEKAGIVEVTETRQMILEFQYAEKDKILYELEKLKYKMQTEYKEAVKIMIDVPNEKCEEFAQSMLNLTEGKIRISFLSE